MAVEYKDYYQSLGVARGASEDEIRKGFRKLARVHHPDVAKNKAQAEEKFKEINEAYEVLSDPEKRRKYDQLGANWKQGQAGFTPPPGWGGPRQANGGESEFHFGGTGFSDFFEQFFSGTRGYSGGPGMGGQRFAQQGDDMEGDILVTLGEVLNGVVRTVSLKRVNPQTGQAEAHSFRVKIPAGVREGRLIRVPGKGGEGIGGANPGDLYLRVRFAKHPDLRVSGNDLHYDLDLAPWEAVLGTTASVSTLEGPVSVRVPPGSGSGQKLRLRGKGLPGEVGRGDLFATISILVPGETSGRERELWEELSRVSTFNPRKS